MNLHVSTDPLFWVIIGFLGVLTIGGCYSFFCRRRRVRIPEEQLLIV